MKKDNKLYSAFSILILIPVGLLLTLLGSFGIFLFRAHELSVENARNSSIKISSQLANKAQLMVTITPTTTPNENIYGVSVPQPSIFPGIKWSLGKGDCEGYIDAKRIDFNKCDWWEANGVENNVYNSFWNFYTHKLEESGWKNSESFGTVGLGDHEQYSKNGVYITLRSLGQNTKRPKWQIFVFYNTTESVVQKVVD